MTPVAGDGAAATMALAHPLLHRARAVSVAAATDYVQGVMACCRVRRRVGAALVHSSTARIRILQTGVLNAPLLVIGGVLWHLGSPAAVWHAVYAAVAPTDWQLPRQCAWSLESGGVAPSCCATTMVCGWDGVGDAIVQAAGVVPYIIVASVLSSVWASQAAGRVWARLHMMEGGGTPAPVAVSSPQATPSPWAAAGEGLYRTLLMVLLAVYVVVLDGGRQYTILARVAAVLLSALTIAFTACDAVWSLEGRPLVQRFQLAEKRWAWLLGLGTIPSLVTFFGPPAVNAAAYNLLYPWIVIIALASRHEMGRWVAVGGGGGPDAVSGRPGGAIPPTSLPWLVPFAWFIRGATRLMPWIMACLTRRLPSTSSKEP